MEIILCVCTLGESGCDAATQIPIDDQDVATVVCLPWCRHNVNTVRNPSSVIESARSLFCENFRHQQNTLVKLGFTDSKKYN